MDFKKNISSFSSSNFYSNEMIISKRSLNENQLKYISKTADCNLDCKHKIVKICYQTVLEAFINYI